MNDRLNLPKKVNKIKEMEKLLFLLTFFKNSTGSIVGWGEGLKENKLGLSCAKLSTAEACSLLLKASYPIAGLLTQQAVAGIGSSGKLQQRIYWHG